MSLRQLQALVAVADRGSFQAAADALGVTQSAVSMQIKALEDDLRAPLFDRSRRPPVITPLGRAVLERAREVVTLYESLRLSATGDLAGRLALGVIPSASTRLLPDALAALKTSHPGLTIRVAGGLSGQLAAQVADGTLDAAVVTEPVSAAALACRTILTEALVLVAHPRHASLATPLLLSSQPFVQFNRRAGVGQVIVRALDRLDLAAQPTMELDSLEAILEMVVRDLGVSVLPENSLAGGWRDRLSVRPFGHPPVTRSVGLIHPEPTPRAGLLDALFDHLRRAARPLSPARTPERSGSAP